MSKSFSKRVSYKEWAEKQKMEDLDFDLDGSLILPRDPKFKGVVRRICRKIFRREDREEHSMKLSELYDQITELLTRTDTGIRPFAYSTGGAKQSERFDSEQKERVQKKQARTEYTIFVVPNKKNNRKIVIIEAIGQKNNATFIGEKIDGIEEDIVELGREGVVKERNIKKSYS